MAWPLQSNEGKAVTADLMALLPPINTLNASTHTNTHDIVWHAFFCYSAVELHSRTDIFKNKKQHNSK